MGIFVGSTESLLVILLVDGFICGCICSAIASSRNMEGGFWWGFFLSVIGIIIVAVRPNETIAESAITNISTNTISEHDVINSIKEYKELYDTGVITEEEFSKKKEQLLNRATTFEAAITNNEAVKANDKAAKNDNDTPSYNENPKLGENKNAPPVQPIETGDRGLIKCPLCGEIQFSVYTSCERCGVKFIKK